jgi:hypothetical protein
MDFRFLTLLLASMSSAAVIAQTVYESKGGQGKVYSDRPLPGGKPVDLRPLNVIEPVPVPPANASPVPAADSSPAKLATPYRSLTVVFPEPGGSVAANNATFEVRLAVDPPLLVEKGHAFALRLDGRPVPGRYTATEMMVPPEFFGNVAPAGVQRHVLEASIIDAGGQTVMQAAPIDFQTRFVTVLQRPHSLQPLPAHPPARVQRPVPPDPGRDQLPRRATEPLPPGPVSPGRSGVSPGKLLPESGR